MNIVKIMKKNNGSSLSFGETKLDEERALEFTFLKLGFIGNINTNK